MVVHVLVVTEMVCKILLRNAVRRGIRLSQIRGIRFVACLDESTVCAYTPQSQDTMYSVTGKGDSFVTY